MLTKILNWIDDSEARQMAAVDVYDFPRGDGGQDAPSDLSADNCEQETLNAKLAVVKA